MKKIGIVGFGEMGKRHSKDMEEFSNGRINVAAVVELSDEAFAVGCEWLGKKPMRFFSLEAMLAEVALDGIIISTPNSLHWEYLSKLENKSIPVLLEKPLDTDLVKIRKVLDFSKNYDAPIMVHHVMRYSPIVLKAKEIIDSGKIGKIAGFNLVQSGKWGMFHNFRRTFKNGGGQLLEKATHDFDILLFLTGSMPTKVAAACRTQCYGGNMPDDLHCPDCIKEAECKYSTLKETNGAEISPTKDLCVFASEIDIFDNENCLIELSGGEIGTYSECFFSYTPFSRRYEFNGTKGFLSIDFTAGSILLVNDAGEKTYQFDYCNRIHYNGSPGVVKHFEELMEGNTKKVHSPVDEAFAAEMISFAAYHSNFTGTYVNIKEINGKEGLLTIPRQKNNFSNSSEITEMSLCSENV